MMRIFGVLTALVLATSAYAQSGSSVRQSGNVTPNHAASWVSQGIIGDGGTASDSPITSLGVTSNTTAGFCVSSGRSTAAGRQQLCMGAPLGSNAIISLQNYGTATAQGLNLVINGAATTIPSTGGDFLTGTSPYSAGHVPCFTGTTSAVLDCGLALSSGTVTTGVWEGTAVALGFGGTGASSATGARSNLGLGTIALQNSSSVAITGGTITGMPSPTISSDVATKSYVDATSAGLNILASSVLATVVVLPNSPTYSNGASGVGATLTAGSNTTLTVDGIVAGIDDIVLVKNQASTFQNGIYKVTTIGGGVPWVLTRATYFDQAAEMLRGSYTFITGGAVNINSSWTLQTAVTTVGTDALTFNQFSSTTGVVTSATVAAGAGISVSGTCTITSSGTCTVSATPAAPPAGRLTLQTGTPVMSTSQSNKATIYYDCSGGNVVPYYNGSVDLYDTIAACEVSTAMVSAASAGQTLAGGVYDVWWVHGGASRICLAMSSAVGGGNGWAGDTGGSSTARGTGYTKLDFLTRPYVTNQNSITNCFNGATNYGPVTANQGTYLGTVYMISNGTTTFTFGSNIAGGGQGIFGVWNMYNRVDLASTVTDSNNWSYGTSAAWRSMDASDNNRHAFVIGVAQDGVGASITGLTNACTTSTSCSAYYGLALDSNTTADRSGGLSSTQVVGVNAYGYGAVTNTYNGLSGIHFIQAVENSSGIAPDNRLGGVWMAFDIKLRM